MATSRTALTGRRAGTRNSPTAATPRVRFAMPNFGRASTGRSRRAGLGPRQDRLGQADQGRRRRSPRVVADQEVARCRSLGLDDPRRRGRPSKLAHDPVGQDRIAPEGLVAEPEPPGSSGTTSQVVRVAPWRWTENARRRRGRRGAIADAAIADAAPDRRRRAGRGSRRGRPGRRRGGSGRSAPTRSTVTDRTSAIAKTRARNRAQRSPAPGPKAASSRIRIAPSDTIGLDRPAGSWRWSGRRHGNLLDRSMVGRTRVGLRPGRSGE